jgi:phosphoribosyl-ATP pyrophosphohydrolase
MGTEILDEIFEVIKDRKQNPKPESYVSNLLKSGRARTKVLEEARELVDACEKQKEEVVHEAADLIFHTMVLLAEKDVELAEVMRELERRRKR